MLTDKIKIGKELFEQEKYKRAYNQFKKATKQAPEDYEAWFFKAQALYEHNIGSHKRMDKKVQSAE